MSSVKLFQDAIDSLAEDPAIADELGKAADKVRASVRAPRHLRVWTRRGVGPRGAFAQVGMTGQGALAIEYGSRKNRALAPLRSAIRSI